MNLQKLPLLLGFNLILAIADVILLSKGILQLDNLVRIIIILASIVIFFIGNYFILSSAYKKPRIKNVENADYDDFEDALKGWKGMNTPFNKQIDVALKPVSYTHLTLPTKP